MNQPHTHQGEQDFLQVRDLSLTLGGRLILDHLNIDFWKGHVHALVGPNGAGKSTLASTIMGLSGYTEHEGDILLEGTSLKDRTLDERARMGMTLGWQEPARFEGLSVKRFILAGAKEPSEKTVRDALNEVGLDPDSYMDRAADKTLSGGERKRIELASILAMKPRLVLLDEPDSGIDVEALNRIFDAIEILRDDGATVILITHSLTVLEHAEHAFLMCCGRIIGKGRVDKIETFFQNKCGKCSHQNEPFNGEAP